MGYTEMEDVPEVCVEICDQLLAFAPTRPIKANMCIKFADDEVGKDESEYYEDAAPPPPSNRAGHDTGTSNAGDGCRGEREECRDHRDDEEDDMDVPEVVPFVTSSARPNHVVAVDCGMIRLGETEAGPIIALRAAVVIDRTGGTEVRLLRTGPLFLSNPHKLEILHALGKSQGQQDFFVTMNDADPPRPLAVKRGVADTGKYYGDRFRSWWERVAQSIAVEAVENGTILFDGALTLRSRDTPDANIKRLARTAGEHGSNIIAIAKQSELAVAGKSVRWWLDDAPTVACYRDLTPLLRNESGHRDERVLGSVFATRFSGLGPTFRVDVKPAPGASNDEALGQMYASVGLRCGYPEILVRAHAYSYFPHPDVVQLQAQACSMYSLIPQPDVRIDGAWGPFAGSYK